jgi:hypothetical protein
MRDDKTLGSGGLARLHRQAGAGTVTPSGPVVPAAYTPPAAPLRRSIHVDAELALPADDLLGLPHTRLMIDAAGKVCDQPTGQMVHERTEFVAGWPERAWKHWEDGRVTEQIRFVEGEWWPTRKELEPQWVKDPNDEDDKDPWQKMSLLVLINFQTKEPFCYTCGGFYGPKEISNLVDRIALKRIDEPGVWPIVTLIPRSLTRPKKRPFWILTYRIGGWATPAGARLPL